MFPYAMCNKIMYPVITAGFKISCVQKKKVSLRYEQSKQLFKIEAHYN
jgi:hypothetical protein